ncbi:hypothetical protein BH10PAT1_BH10PAT1_2580 [soil metagenome]
MPEIFDALKKAGCFTNQEVTSKAGQNLDFYMDIRKLGSHPLEREIVINKMADILKKLPTIK